MPNLLTVSNSFFIILNRYKSVIMARIHCDMNFQHIYIYIYIYIYICIHSYTIFSFAALLVCIDLCCRMFVFLSIFYIWKPKHEFVAKISPR